MTDVKMHDPSAAIMQGQRNNTDQARTEGISANRVQIRATDSRTEKISADRPSSQKFLGPQSIRESKMTDLDSVRRNFFSPHLVRQSSYQIQSIRKISFGLR